MSNASRSSVARRGEPGLIPRRGAAALLVTAGGLALLFSFRAPEADLFGAEGLLLEASDPGFAVAGRSLPSARPSAALSPSASPVATAAPKVFYGPPAPGAKPSAPPTPVPAPTRTPTSTAPTRTTAPARPTAPAVATADQVVDGKVLRTPYGDVQVEVTIRGGQLADVTTLQLPDSDRHSRRISEIVGPMLREDALNVGSARIHGVSGATYTSMGYARSLQSALDKAGI